MGLSRENKAQIRAQILQKPEQLEGDITAFKEITKPVSPENAIGRISLYGWLITTISLKTTSLNLSSRI